MGKFLEYILEITGLVGMVGLISYISWTKMALGTTLSLLGAYYPQMNKTDSSSGKTEIGIGQTKIKLHGTLRFVIVVAGLVLIIGSVVDGHIAEKNSHTSDKPSIESK